MREYSFLLRHALNETREFTLTIVNDAFNSRRVRYQDAPELCSLKLHRELADSANNPLKTHYRISETELDDYQASHSLKVAN